MPGRQSDFFLHAQADFTVNQQNLASNRTVHEVDTYIVATPRTFASACSSDVHLDCLGLLVRPL